MLGSNAGSARIFLSVGFGKIRQKSLENKEKVTYSTPGAIKRETQQGAETWAIEHDYVGGIIENIMYKEDDKYGNTFEVVLSDGIDKYQLSFPEDSRFWFDFMKKLPNIDIKSKVKITTYDFIDKSKGKRRAGVSVEQADQKITSFYDKKKEDNTWELLNGFPDSNGVDFHDTDELKIYFIKVKKFLRSEFQRLIVLLFEFRENNKIDEPDLIPDNTDATDDLPF